MRSWRSAERSVSGPAAYARLVLSFDPRDTPADMAMLAHHLEVEPGEDWTFAIATPDDVRRLAEATGFWYEWDRNLNQFDHPAMLVGIRKGRLVRLLVGGSVTSARLDELVREVSGVFVPSYPLPSRARFRCVQFEETTGRVVLDWGFALLLVPVFSTSMVTMGLFMVGARRRASWHVDSTSVSAMSASEASPLTASRPPARSFPRWSRTRSGVRSRSSVTDD